ncbi:MAG: helix-turn-helix domain-containing protein [Acidimicrobiales bacterium]
MSQQSVSKRIAKLETTVGTALLRRSRSGASLMESFSRKPVPSCGVLARSTSRSHGQMYTLPPSRISRRALIRTSLWPLHSWSMVWHRRNCHSALFRLITHITDAYQPFDQRVIGSRPQTSATGTSRLRSADGEPHVAPRWSIVRSWRAGSTVLRDGSAAAEPSGHYRRPS